MSNPVDNKNRTRAQDPDLTNALAYLAKHPSRFLFPLVVTDPKVRPKGKPAFKNNLALASNDPAQFTKWYEEHRRRGRVLWACSLKKSGLVAIDVDCAPGKVGAASLRTLIESNGPLPNTEVVRSPSYTPETPSRHIMYSGEHHFSTDKLGKNIDVPNYVLIAETKFDDGRAYVVSRDLPVAPLPEWVAEKIKPRSAERSNNPPADAIPLDVFKKMLAATPYTSPDAPEGFQDRHSYGGWLNFAMECHEAAGGDEADYLDAFITWSLADPSPDWTAPTSTDYIISKWETFTADPPPNAAARTRGSWLKLLMALDPTNVQFIGDANPADAEFTDDQQFGDKLNVTGLDSHPSVTAEVIAEWQERHRKRREEKNKAKAETSSGPIVYDPGYTADELADREFPPPVEIIEGMLLEGLPATMDGDGGVGKSLISAQISVHRAAGQDFLGRKMKQGPAIFITHEDRYNIVKARMEATANFLGLPETIKQSDGTIVAVNREPGATGTIPGASRLRGLPLRSICIDDADLCIAVIDDNGKWTAGPYYKTFEKLLAATPGALVFLDCRTDFVQGDFVTNRDVPNTFYKKVIAGLNKKYDVTIVPLCHPSKASMESGDYYEGTTANRTAVRGKLVMKLASKKDQDGPRWFGNLKRQYGPNGGLVKVVFNPQYEIFTADTDPNLTEEVRLTYIKIIDKVLELIGRGITVCKFNQSSGQGPNAIATAMGEDDDGIAACDPKDVLKALEWGQRQGKIRHVDRDRGKRIPEHYERNDAASDFGPGG